MNDIDALTLKLLTSKKKYNTYLGTVEPNTASKIREYCDAIHANKDRIRALFDKYMEDPEIQITNELDDSVESCLKELLRHLDNPADKRDREKKSARNDYDEEDEDEEDEEDSCFATKATKECDFSNTTFEIAEEMFKGTSMERGEKPKKEKTEAKEKQSFWGKGVNRASGTLDSFVHKN
jgi:hypothetical protein